MYKNLLQRPTLTKNSPWRYKFLEAKARQYSNVEVVKGCMIEMRSLSIPIQQWPIRRKIPAFTHSSETHKSAPVLIQEHNPILDADLLSDARRIKTLFAYLRKLIKAHSHAIEKRSGRRERWMSNELIVSVQVCEAWVGSATECIDNRCKSMSFVSEDTYWRTVARNHRWLKTSLRHTKYIHRQSIANRFYDVFDANHIKSWIFRTAWSSRNTEEAYSNSASQLQARVFEFADQRSRLHASANFKNYSACLRTHEECNRDERHAKTKERSDFWESNCKHYAIEKNLSDFIIS
jgi:hypothetical protein